ncbi:MAG TPA: MmcQ/YjbR family DNA-binding protein [Stackebrandtia sp.]|jgi:predicted DNA-binding protein (MmcQ/YjbR family)|uniref:MmcQ/YjbR family DNA-binding protein n=1 Tax=Stackebrandtia sp. TaxID=2023065 RepID=UPI002D227F79|nr:MmcQ/YjbR family DNA-binding protein [Stackebrandtia sp.]HZE37610.1 MmcQ/YjbR family DNA-binding protein [Stackebrandtia sp.]
MTPDELKDALLRLPGAVEEFPFPRYPDVSVFKVGGKMFAISTLDEEPLSVGLKCDPELAVQLRDTHPEIIPGYHLNKRHWNTVRLDGDLPPDFVDELITDSYDLVVAKLPKRSRP